MLLQHLAEHIAEPIIVVQTADLGDHAEPLKRFIVQFINEGKMWVRHDDVGQLLDISETMRETSG